MKKGSAFLIVVLFLSGCLSQKEPVPPAPTEQEIINEYNMPRDVGNLLINIDQDNDFNNPKEQGVIDFFNTYKHEQFFQWLVEDVKANTNRLENVSPWVTNYREAAKMGVNPEAVYCISPKLKSEDKDAVYGLLKGLDSQSQIEAAKAYGVNLEFNELEFLAEGAGKVLQGGYSDIEDKYIEKVMQSFNADLAKYLTRGALNDDGTVTNKDLDGLNWFATEYPKMSSAMKSHFYYTYQPSIGTVDSIYITDESVRDPRAYASAPEEAKYLIPKEGYKVAVDVLNPGDYMKDGRRYIHIDTYAEKNAKENGENPMKFYATNANSRKTWFFDDPLILGPNDLPIERIDHAISTVNGKFYVTSGIRVYSGKSETDLWTGWGNYYYYYGNKMDIGAARLVDMVCDGYSRLQHEPRNLIYIYIYI